MADIKLIGVIGAGIAQLAATHGVNVRILDYDSEALTRASKSIATSIHVSKNHLSRDVGADAKRRLRFTSDLNDLRDTDVVVEAIVVSEDV